MGDFTEFDFNSKLKSDVPKPVLEILNCMLGQTNKPKTLPGHRFFENKDWQFIFQNDSDKFDSETRVYLLYNFKQKSWYLRIRCHLENDKYQIERFVDWIMPYLFKNENDFLGFSRKQNNNYPMWIQATEKASMETESPQ